MEETSVYADRMVTYDSDIQWLYQPEHITPTTALSEWQTALYHRRPSRNAAGDIYRSGSGELRWLVEYVGHIQFWRLQNKSADNDPNYTQCHFRFAGLYEDSEPSLYYHRFRY